MLNVSDHFRSVSLMTPHQLFPLKASPNWEAATIGHVEDFYLPLWSEERDIL